MHEDDAPLEVLVPNSYKTLPEMLGNIPGENGKICRNIYEAFKPRFQNSPGSSNNHQAWRGGYHDHVTEVMNLAYILYEPLNARRKLPFTLESVLLVLFLHDIEKPWRFEVGPRNELSTIIKLDTKEDREEFRNRFLADWNITLTPEEQNALKYVEGEYKDYSDKKRVSGPLAAFCHLCDTASARIWFDHPKGKHDEWQ